MTSPKDQMRKWLACSVALVLSGELAWGEQDHERRSKADEIKAFLKENFSKTNAAIVIGLVDDYGSQIFSAGELDNGTDRVPDGETLFEIASITKTFTVLLLEDMVERGEMKLDDPVEKHLPESVRVPMHNGKKITLLDLATHTSGLPRDPDNLTPTRGLPENSFADYTAERLYMFLGSFVLSRDPGERFEYSNVGMALLGHVLARKAGTNFETLVIERICQPLKMDSTRITLTPELKTRLATGHDQRGDRAPNWEFLVYDGTGGLRSTANDLLKYLSANLGLKRSDLTPLMERTHMIRHRGSATHGDTAMAWTVRGEGLESGRRLLGHAGGSGGYETFIGLDETQRKGVVVLCSQQGGMSPETLGWLLLRGISLSPAIARALLPAGDTAGVGVGLALDPTNHAVRIIQVLSNSPAAQAGLSTGLIVQKIDEMPVAGRELIECVGFIRGTAGTKVRIEFVDADHSETNRVELIRQKIRVTN
jgi:CubicO group peptidase (beta-lactamase class C family)